MLSLIRSLDFRSKNHVLLVIINVIVEIFIEILKTAWNKMDEEKRVEGEGIKLA